jgi:hypothetical protein
MYIARYSFIYLHCLSYFFLYNSPPFLSLYTSDKVFLPLSLKIKINRLLSYAVSLKYGTGIARIQTLSVIHIREKVT